MVLRRFSTLLLCLSLIVVFAAESPGGTAAPQIAPSAALERLVSMQQTYAVSFLWFDRLAQGSMRFEREAIPGRYRAVLEGKTLGSAAWLTGDRVQRYETLMEWTPQGRLRPIEHSAHLIKGKGDKRAVQTKFYVFNDRDRNVTVKRIRNGKTTSGKSIALSQPELPDDFLTAFFNFAIGVYGPVQVGGKYSIPTLTRHGETRIEAAILKPEAWPKDSFFSKKTGLLLKVILDPEVLDTGGGAVYALLDEQGRPTRVLVENVLEMGDVRGVAK